MKREDARSWPLILCAIAQLSCAAEHRRPPKDTLVMVLEGTFKDIDPRYCVTTYDTKLSRLVAPGLMTVDSESMEPEPLLAHEAISVDALTWDIVLRTDVRFANGDPLRADDVVYTYMSVLDPKTKAMQAKAFGERFASIEAIAPDRVRFRLKKPLATFLSDLEFGILPRPKTADADGRFSGGKVIGAGAFYVESFSDRHVLLTKNPFTPNPPGVEHIDIQTIADENSRAVVLAGGAADFAQNSMRLDVVDKLAAKAGMQLLSGKSAILTFLMCNLNDPILKDVRVRTALAMAIDREQIISAKLHGHAQIASSLLAQTHWAFAKNVLPIPFNLEAAKKLLDEAGYPDPDGPGGEPRFRLTYKTSADRFRVSIARVLQAQLEELGIAVDLRSFEFNTFFNDVKTGNFQLATMQSGEITEPDWFFTYFHSSRIPSKAEPGTHNRMRYRNPELDQLLEEGRQTSDRDMRKAAYQTVQEILARDLPMIPLWHEDNIALANKEVQGYAVLPNARLTNLAHVKKVSAAP